MSAGSSIVAAPDSPTLTEPHPQTKPDFNDTATAFAAKSDESLGKSWWLFKAMNFSELVDLGNKLAPWALQTGLLPERWIKLTLFDQFCGGEDIADCQQTITHLRKYHVGAILDYSVEGEKSEPGFDATCQETLETIHTAAKQPKAIPFSVFKVTGLASFSLLEKIQAKETLSPEETAAFERVKDRVQRICQLAHDLRVRIFMDGEETWIQDVIDELCYDMMLRYNHEQPIVFNTYQMYRVAALGHMKQAHQRMQAAGVWFGAKLVRGAYMEKERRRAKELGYPDPIQPDKASSDHDYDAGIAYCMEQIADTAFCAGTHNEHSSLLLTQLMAQAGLANDDSRIWFAQLYGMSDNISFTLAKSGYNVAKYLPYGPVKAVMPYLMRRAQENSSIKGQSSREFNLVNTEVTRRKTLK